MNFPIKQLDLPDLAQGIPQNKPSRLQLILFVQPDDQHERRGGHILGLNRFGPNRPLVALAR